MATKQQSAVMVPTFRRVYIDLPTKVAVKLDQLAAEAGTSKKAWLANLVIREAEKSDKRSAT